MSQSADLHRALLRPFILTTLRAAGFHSTRPAVLDTLLNLTERHLTLLASTTASHALSAHNTPTPTITDVRLALTDCGVLIGSEGASEEAWSERMRRALGELVDVNPLTGKVGAGGEGEREGKRRIAEKRKREEEDTRDVAEFVGWFEGRENLDGGGAASGGSVAWREIKRVAGVDVEAGPAVGVGGGVVQAEDFLSVLKKKQGRVGGDEDARLAGTVLGKSVEEREVAIEGGPVVSIRDWRPTVQTASGGSADTQRRSDAMSEGSAMEIEAPG